MSSSLLKFLVSLATDAQLMELYLKDPAAACGQYGLSEAETELIVQKKAGAIEAAVGEADVGEPVPPEAPGSLPFSLTISGTLPPPTASAVSHFVILTGFTAVVPLVTTEEGLKQLKKLKKILPPPMGVPVSHFVTPADLPAKDESKSEGPKTPRVPPAGPTQ